MAVAVESIRTQKYKHASYDVSISGIERIVGADLGDFLELFEGFSKTGKVEDLHITKSMRATQ